MTNESPAIGSSRSIATARELYLDLLRKSLTGMLSDTTYALIEPLPKNSVEDVVFSPLRAILNRLPLQLVRRVGKATRAEGQDWPLTAETMIGERRLDHLQRCIVDVLSRAVGGDLIETGVWRGGATILMRAVLKAYADESRAVWVADSFQGLPRPDAEHYPADRGDRHHNARNLAVSLEAVKQNFSKYSLLDERVRFLPGWFRDSLPSAPIQRLALMRLDGDMYQSTFEALDCLYPKLSIGGYVIVDDYGNERLPCRQAVDDYRTMHGISEPIEPIDWTGTYWVRRE